MLFNTSYANKEFDHESVAIVGPSYSLIQKLVNGPKGSSRLIIDGFSPKIQAQIKSSSSLHYANIELRPKGIIVHFTQGLERFAWIIPYYRLAIYNTSKFSIHGDGQFIKFRKDKHYKSAKGFIEKMAQDKIDFLNLDYYQD
ncbi:MAG: hypothetical protein P8O93_07965 [Flavobacteriaceae bacterium]|nr:hypothetical protein [Flavobacteriaceae bacterium]MDG1961832.1 hypothetical protein [Flavobacteriaceae bacterium]